MASFVSLFSKLDPSVQYRLVLKLEAQGKFQFKGIESYQFLFQELCRASLTCNFDSDISSMWSIREMVVELVKCFVRVRNAEYLRSLISVICKPTTSKGNEKFNTLKEGLPGKLISSPEFWELVSSSELESSAACTEWYRDTCRLLVTKDFVSLVKSSGDVSVKIVHCLLSLNDEACWQSFAERICASFASKKNDMFVRLFLRNVEIQQSILKSPIAFASFNRIVDHWVEQWKSYKEPVFSWQRKANVPSYPEVDAFLRSPVQESMTYNSNFEHIDDARCFARRIKKKGLKNGFNVVIKSKRNKKEPRCVITKVRNYHEIVKRISRKEIRF